jgi:hypothetical protein
MKTMDNTSGGYAALQGAAPQGDPRVFGIAATIAVLLVSCVVAFKMVAPETRAAALRQLPSVAQWVPLPSPPGPTARASAAPAPSMVLVEH